MKAAFMIKFRPTLIKFCLNTNVEFVKVISQHCLITIIENWKKSLNNFLDQRHGNEFLRIRNNQKVFRYFFKKISGY